MILSLNKITERLINLNKAEAVLTVLVISVIILVVKPGAVMI